MRDMAVDQGPAVPQAEYFAFISYSHRDSATVRRIHRALETYRIPAALVGKESLLGPVPPRLFPIFRDREELSAGGNLSEQVMAALGRSGALLVFCSPNAKASEWVNKEIEEFRKLFPDRPIFAGLIEGEPEQAFPPALTADGKDEPVAADFRKCGDGFQLATLKLVSGLAHVPLDGLVQRDAQRKVRRVTTITLAALAAMLVLAASLVIAIRSRAEAVRQREEAEGLVEYMLTDLRDRLKGVGRLDVMGAVNQRALTYYADQGNLERLPDASLERRARILHAMGEDDRKRGDLAAAQAKFVQAHRTTAATLKRNPGSADAIFAHAQSEYWLGSIAEKRSNWTQAASNYRNYAALAALLVRIDPHNQAYMMEMGWGELDRGIIEFKSRSDSAYGSARFLRAADWFDTVLKLAPDDLAALAELANARAWLADAHYLQGDMAKSLVARQSVLDLRSQIHGHKPKDAEALYLLAKARFSLAANLMQVGRREEALSLFRSASTELTYLRAIEPSDVRWRNIQDRINSFVTMGRDSHVGL